MPAGPASALSVTVSVAAGNGYTISSTDRSATVAVDDDDDAPKVSVPIADASGTEGAEIRFNVTLSEAVEHTVRVRWKSDHAYHRNDFAVDTMEFWIMSGWLTFAPGEMTPEGGVCAAKGVGSAEQAIAPRVG